MRRVYLARAVLLFGPVVSLWGCYQRYPAALEPAMAQARQRWSVQPQRVDQKPHVLAVLHLKPLRPRPWGRFPAYRPRDGACPHHLL